MRLLDWLAGSLTATFCCLPGDLVAQVVGKVVFREYPLHSDLSARNDANGSRYSIPGGRRLFFGS